MTKWPQNGFPKARSADLITERVGKEVVAYDGLTSEAHCLNRLAAAVFGAADGETSPADIALIATAVLNDTVSVDQVEQAIAELEQRGLILPTDSSGISRRQLMRKGAAVGGAAVAASLVTSVVTPAYGATGSGYFNDPFSTLGVVLYDCNTPGTYYYMKWDNDKTTGSISGPLCGINNKIGGCGYLPAPPSATPSNIEGGCLPGVNLQITGTPPTGIRLTWPDGACYKVYAWRVFCGTTRCWSGGAGGSTLGSQGDATGTLASGNGYLDLPITNYCG